MPNVYLCCYHSEPGRHLNARAQGDFLLVEQAIVDRVWPYDNGDDPSFYVSEHHRTPLTWGVCRYPVRRTIQERDVVAFFAFQRTDQRISYFLTAVATVAKKISHCKAFGCASLGNSPYLNRLIEEVDGEWRQAEHDRPRSAKHADWERRIAGESYVIFSSHPSETYISPKPPLVAAACPNEAGPPRKGFSEVWEPEPYEVVFSRLPNARRYLRTSTGYGNQHPHIRQELSDDKARSWRENLIRYLHQGNDVPHIWRNGKE